MSCNHVVIHKFTDCLIDLLAEYVKDEADRADWAKEGIEIGRAAWKVALSTYDFEMEKVVLNVAFLYHLLKMRQNREAKDRISVK